MSTEPPTERRYRATSADGDEYEYRRVIERHRVNTPSAIWTWQHVDGRILAQMTPAELRCVADCLEGV